jgi:hypothetical protein
MYEGESVEWSIDQEEDEVANDNELVKILIKDFIGVEKHTNWIFAYGLLPTKILTDEIEKYSGELFSEYHKWYGNATDHGNSILPIIINFNNEELIEDGWHRFHSYFEKGLTKIPVVLLKLIS